MTAHSGKLPQDIYDESLKIISNVYFSRREIDIIACLLSGRTAKSIGPLLSIAPRTVETHTRNITLKLERNSREGIRDFIEKSDKFLRIRDYYISLLVQCAFEKRLSTVATLRGTGRFTCLIIYCQSRRNKPPIISHIEEHLKSAGIMPLIEIEENFYDIFSLNHHTDQQSSDYRICVVEEAFLVDYQNNTPQKKPVISNALSPKEQLGSLLFLLTERDPATKIPQHILDVGYVECGSQENYYEVFFEILKRMLPFTDLDEMILGFKKEYENIIGSHSKESSLLLKPEEKNIRIPEEETDPEKGHLLLAFFKKKKWILGGAGILCLSSIFILFLVGGYPQPSGKNTEARFLGPDLPIPALLNRPKLIRQIDNKLTVSDDGIQTVALIGMGGSGKTTLARQYAHSQKSSVIWEINAENKNSLANSFEALAYTLCKTDEEKKVLMSLKEIKNFTEKEEKIIQLVKGQLKIYPDWLLIYDNVEKFSDIQKYFPSGANFWGKGKVIITTQDTHIQNNGYVKGTLWIGELDPNEKLSLFTKIMNRGAIKPFDLTQQDLARKFLEKIPAFPLDISVAAYYIKATNIDYDKYAKNLVDYKGDFSAVQGNILKEATSYKKTRYHIIALSLEKLITADKDFGDLLALISFLDSKNIPRDLLNNYKGRVVVDNFIYHLKKYSLILDPLTQPQALLSHISIHRSAQDISSIYLTGFLKLDKDNPLMKSIMCIIDNYVGQAIEEEDFPRMQVMAEHLVKLLDHPNLLSDFSRGLLESKLGCMYYFFNDNQSRQLLGGSHKLLTLQNSKILSPEDKMRIASSLLHIGAVYTELRLYKQSRELLEEVASIYGKGKLKDEVELSWALTHLGNIYRNLGDYEKARGYLEESIRLNKQNIVNNRRLVCALSYLGSVYRGLGSYQKSIGTLEESLNLCKKYYSDDHFRVGRILTSLGNVHRKLGVYKTAKGYLENGLSISKKHFPKDHINIGLAMVYLGNCLRELGDYEKSCHYLEQSLAIHQKHFPENHERMGWVLFHLASTYKALGKRQQSQELFEKVLKIYARNFERENVESARILRNIAEIYLERNRLEKAENLIKRSIKILQGHNHLETYMSLEILGEIYVKKYTMLTSTTSREEAWILKSQAMDQFSQALTIIEKRFPKNSTHIQRIHSRIKYIQGESTKNQE